MPQVTELYLVLGAAMFSIGVLGVLTRKNAIIVFMCIELMLNAVNLTVVALAREFGHASGQVFVFFVMAIAAAEAAVGLAIILSVFRNFYTIGVDDVHDLHG